MRRTLALLLLPLLLLCGLAACGDDGDPDDPSAEEAAGGEGTVGDAFPVTIEHRHGETVLDARPERIVSLNVQWTDAVLALGEEPVAYVLDAAAGETDLYPWQQGELGGSKRIDAAGAIPFEAIAAERPDLILVTFAAQDAAVYEQLSGIAPTIGLLGDLEVDPWEDLVEVLGEALGEEDAAREAIAEVDAQIAAVAERLPRLDGATYTLTNYVPGDALYVIADPDDGASQLFYALGLEIAPDVLAEDTEAVGRVQVSLERAELLDADFIGILANGADPAELPGWANLTGVQSGAVVDFELADVVGLNTPSVASIPYVLELITPALEKVAAARAE